jgi:hypothetical protein
MWRNAFLVYLGAAVARAAEPNTADIADFQKRIADYLKIQSKARSVIGNLKPTASADRIGGHEKRLAEKIREIRGHVTQGNIFTAEIAAGFRQRIANATKSGDATTVHQSLRRSEPVKAPLRVDGSYPKGVPLETTPPSLLLQLPKVPRELEYRVVGHALVLRDAAANLIVDFLPDVIP